MHVCVQVVKLKVEVTRMKGEASRSQKLGKAEGRGVLEQVSNLQGALDDAHGGREQLRMKAHNAEAQRAAAQRREAQLQVELTAVQTKLEIADEEVEKLRSEVRAIHGAQGIACPCCDPVRLWFDSRGKGTLRAARRRQRECYHGQGGARAGCGEVRRCRAAARRGDAARGGAAPRALCCETDA